MKRTLVDKLNATVEELRSMRDEIKLHLHLAGMDARDEIKELGYRLTKAEQTLRDSLARLRPPR